MIIKRRRSDNFALVPNSIWEPRTGVLRREGKPDVEVRLSFAAKALLAYLLGRPNSWRVRVDHLQRVTDFGRDKVYDLVNELIACGYARRETNRDAAGKITDMEIVICDEPIEVELVPAADETPLPENTEVDGEPLPDLPDPVNTEVVKEEKDINTPPKPPSVAAGDLAAGAEAMLRQQPQGRERRRRLDPLAPAPHSAQPARREGTTSVVQAAEPVVYRRCAEREGRWGRVMEWKSCDFATALVEEVRADVRRSAARA